MLTDVLEGTEMYSELQKVAFEYAEMKGEYKDRLKAARALYKDVEGYQGVEGFKKIKGEVLADIIGDYIFTDQEFINNLSANHRNVFQKAWDEIKYLHKIATAGSKEARELEKVKKAFEDAYRATKEQKNTASNSGAQYSIERTKTMSWSEQINGALYDGKGIRRNDTLVVGSSADTSVANEIDNKPLAIPQGVLSKASSGKDISHSIKKGKLAKLDEGIKKAPITIVNPDRNAVVYVTNIKQGGLPILVSFDMNANFDGDNVHKATSIHLQVDTQAMLESLPATATVYVQKNELDPVGATNNLRGLAAKIKFIDGTIPNNNRKVKRQYSLSYDSDGNQLSKRQQEYFKDSQVRDENGNLLVMYHGTPDGSIASFKAGTYFTANKEYADRYQNPGASSISTGKTASNPKTFSVYLDIKKPFDVNYAEAKRIYVEEYIKGGNALGINPYLSDAEYSKISSIDWTEGEDLRDFLVENGYDYDGIVLDEGADGGYGDVVKYRGQSYMIFSPEQAKSIDDQSPTADLGLRYSLNESEASAGTIDNWDQMGYNNKNGEGYVRTDGFRELQAESRGMSDKDIQLYHSGHKQIDEGIRANIAGVFHAQINAYRDGLRNDNGVLTLSAKSSEFNILESVDGSLFHDVFEIARKYLRNGELVDLHEIKTTEDGIGYNDCFNYLSEDGLSGFSITPDGDLISVFNASGKSGFLSAIAPLIKARAKTLDCYNSSNQPLRGMYEKIFGFKTASVMDYNMEYDHDNIAENHGMPKIAFMVNSEADIKVREFSKDEYDEAAAYRNSFVNQAAADEAAFFEPKTKANDIAPIKDSLSRMGDTQTYGTYNIKGKDVALDIGPVRDDIPAAPQTTLEAPVRYSFQKVYLFY